jgi:hypothetical protein
MRGRLTMPACWAKLSCPASRTVRDGKWTLKCWPQKDEARETGAGERLSFRVLHTDSRRTLSQEGKDAANLVCVRVPGGAAVLGDDRAEPARRPGCRGGRDCCDDALMQCV